MDGENFFYKGQKGTMAPVQQTSAAAKAVGFDHHNQQLTARGIDLNEQLVKNKPATFFLRVHSDAMEGAGVHPGDVVIVDRSLEPHNGKLVIAAVDGELLIRRLEISGGKKRLVPATKKLSPIDLCESAGTVWGVVTYVIHNV